MVHRGVASWAMNMRSLLPELQWYFIAFALRSIHVYARQGQGNTKVDVSKHQGNLQPTSSYEEVLYYSRRHIIIRGESFYNGAKEHTQKHQVGSTTSWQLGRLH